ncbi:MAG: hypothetical protein GXP21_05515 [Gammaproteobacteria bacterium]|nr:hypothetical protein [Gammaproteobacteria bacterium]
MNHSIYKKLLPLAVAFATIPSMAFAVFDSGSTETDGAFTPTVNTQLTLPADGIFNFTNVNIPTGVTITFQRNATNTPVTILASGDVTIDGTIDVSGGNATNVGTAGDGNVGDDGLPGIGGPGGFDGGAGGDANGNRIAATGLGPGAGAGGAVSTTTNFNCGGGGANYGDNTALGASGRPQTTGTCRVDANDTFSGSEGTPYGSENLLPLIGGSGGGGGGAGRVFSGSGGGGGGGAILIAVSGAASINGSILANGGSSGSSSGSDRAGSGSTGGGGSGGAIRIVASTLQGNGSISANFGSIGGNSFTSTSNGGRGGLGRIRLEAESFNFVSSTTPLFSFFEPQDIFVPGLPNLRITSVAGVAAPASPTGSADILLPAGTANPVTVAFVSSGVPVGNTVQLTVTPASAPPTSTLSGALSGDIVNATASATIELPEGPSTLSAQVSFTVTASIGDDMSRFAKGERVERIVVAAGMDGSSETVLITVSGKEYRYSGALPSLATSQAAS